MTHSDRYHGGLVFVGRQDNALDRFCRIVASTLDDYGHVVERQTVLDDHIARVVTSQYRIKIALENQPVINLAEARIDRMDDAAGLNRHARPDLQADISERPQRVTFAITPVAPGQEDRDITELMLVVMMYRMVDAFSVKQIEWLDPATQLTVDQFLSAFSNISPRRIRSGQDVIAPKRNRFAPIEETEPDLAVQCATILGRSPYAGEEGLIELTEEEALALAFRADARPGDMDGAEETQSDIRRLASWGMTGMLVFISAPVAASLAAVNLARGEDFRLNTQVLSLTGFVATMQGTGMLESAAAMFVL